MEVRIIVRREYKKMDIHIQLADMKYIDSCVDILQNSDLGKAYFSDHKKAADMITYAVEQNSVYVALDETEKCPGFIYYMTNGVFGSYPYLHIVAVKEEYRNHGIGKQLIKFFEDNASDSSSAKYFLTVDDFNPGAKRLYENLGYQCVGELPDFYKEGINCYLMMKRREEAVYRMPFAGAEGYRSKTLAYSISSCKQDKSGQEMTGRMLPEQIY